MGHICYLKQNKTTIPAFKNSHSTGEVEIISQCDHLFKSRQLREPQEQPQVDIQNRKRRILNWLLKGKQVFNNNRESSLYRTYTKAQKYERGFPGGSDSKESACSAGDPGSTLGVGRSSGEGNGSPLQYSCLENSMDKAAQRATIHRVAKSRTRLSD